MEQEIKKIVSLLETNNLDDALVLFDTHLENIKDIGGYDKEKWLYTYRDCIYKLGILCSNPEYFQKINNTLLRKINYIGDREVFCFIHSEIIWNFFEKDNFYNKDILHQYIRRYPNNPEFHHTYSHFLEKNNNLEKSLFELKTALKIDINKNFCDTYLSRISLIFNTYLKQDILKAEKFLNEEMNFYNSNNILKKINELGLKIFFNNSYDRLRDHKLIEEKVEYFKKDIENSIQIQQRKLIEILGVFSSIVAFILTNINIASRNLNLKEMLILMFGMSLILLIFTISISYIFGKRYRYINRFSFLKNLKFWAIIFLMIVLILLIFKSDIINQKTINISNLQNKE